MTIGEAYKQLSLLLQAMYSVREARAIANFVIENVTGFGGSERIIHQHENISAKQQERLQQITDELMTHKPVQYVLHEAHWYKTKWYVDEHVLIPRPETEELVDWIIEEGKASRYKTQDLKNKIQETRFNLNDTNSANEIVMLDIGTGSGCIAVALKQNLHKIKMYAADVSAEALHVAKQNAATHKTEIQFVKMNVLDKESWKALPALDYIVSNPPYVTQSEACLMSDNVLKFEPPLALFVPDENPLLFYEAISLLGLQHLKKEGKLFFEINELLGDEVAELLANKGYQNITIQKDMQGKNRMIKAVAPIP